MDCSIVADRVAAYLDGELARSERTLFDEHLERCEECLALLERVSSVDLTPPARAAHTGRPEFWSRMDRVLSDEITSSERVVPPPPPVTGWRGWMTQARLSVSAPLVVGYAALLLFAVLWGMQNLRRAQSAEGQIEAYVAAEQAATEAAAPQPSFVGRQQVRTTSYTPHRGNL